MALQPTGIMLLHHAIFQILINKYTDRKATDILGALMSKRNIDEMNQASETPLAFLFHTFHGIITPRFTVARLLLTSGANINVKGGRNEFVMVISTDVKYTKLLLEGISGNDAKLNINPALHSIVKIYDYYTTYISVQFTFIHDVLIDAV